MKYSELLPGDIFVWYDTKSRGLSMFLVLSQEMAMHSRIKISYLTLSKSFSKGEILITDTTVYAAIVLREGKTYVGEGILLNRGPFAGYVQ